MSEIILTSSVLILVLALLRRLLRGRVNPCLQYALWLLVAARLLIPGSLFSAPVSVMDATADIWARFGIATDSTRGPDIIDTPLIVGLYDLYTVDKEFSSGTTYEQWWEERPGEEYTINGADASLDTGTQVVHYSKYSSIWQMPFWRWPWYAGIGIAATILLLSNLKFYVNLRRKRQRLPPLPEASAGKLPVYLVEGLSSPCLFGVFRPAIYLNEAALEDSRLQHILVHEQTHFRHGDHLWAILRSVCLVIHWYNPLVWWAASLSRRDCELACDAGAIARLGEDQRLDYGATLVGMIVPRASPADLLHTATTMTAGKRTMTERVKLIAQKPRMLKITLAALVLVLCGVVLVTFGGSGAEGSPSDPPEEDGGLTPEDIAARPGLTEAEALALYENAREAWDWFDLGTLPTTSDTFSDSQGAFQRVEGFDTLEELRGYLLTLFSPDLADHLLTSYQPLRETGGALFVQPAGRGSSIYAGEEYAQPFLLSQEEAEQYGYDGHIFAQTEVLDLYEPDKVLYLRRHDWFFSWDGKNYVFSNFGPWDDVDPQQYYNALTILDYCGQGTSLLSWSPMLRDLDWNALRATRDQWPEGFDLGDYVLASIQQYIAGQGQAMSGAEYRNILSATEGLDGAYAEGFSYIVWELYAQDPRQFAQVVLDELSPGQRDDAVRFLAFELAYREGRDESLTLQEVTGRLEQALTGQSLTAANYIHSSGMFSLVLPENWAEDVAIVETEDGVSFYEANTYAAAGYGWLMSIHPQPVSWVEDNSEAQMLVLDSFDTNGTPYQYVLEYRLSMDFSVEPAASPYLDRFQALLDQRREVAESFHLLATPELVSQLIHDNYQRDLALAIAYLPYLSWESYRNAYNESEMEFLLTALWSFADAGKASWEQVHDILSVPSDSAIDGAYATAYQDIFWALYQRDPQQFSSVLGSVYISDTERANVLSWLRYPLSEAAGRDAGDLLTDSEMWERLGLPSAGQDPASPASQSGSGQESEPLVSTGDWTDGEAILGIMRSWSPHVLSLGSPESLEAELSGAWSVQGIQTALEDALSLYLSGTPWDDADSLSGVTVSYSFQFPSDLHDGVVLTVPYTATYTGEPRVLPSGASYTPKATTNELTAAVRLVGNGSTITANEDFQEGQAVYQLLASCVQLPEAEAVSGGEAFEALAYIRSSIEANLAAAGLSDRYQISAIASGSYTQPSQLAPGESETIAFTVSFVPLTEGGISVAPISSQLTIRVAE